MRYPLSKEGVFITIQGEGQLLGVPMVFVRLAGCSVGCPQCDTDYKVAERLTATEIGERIKRVRGNAEWAWVTGGEPADHDLLELLEVCRLNGHVAVATSGSKSLGAAGRLVDFLSVSPHGKPDGLEFSRGSQLNLVPGLNGLRLADWSAYDGAGFAVLYVTPNSDDAGSVAECVEFVQRHPRWRLGVQAHKAWGLP